VDISRNGADLSGFFVPERAAPSYLPGKSDSTNKSDAPDITILNPKEILCVQIPNEKTG